MAEKKAPKKRGRPSEYTPEAAEKVCDLLQTGLSLRKICESPDMPDRSTFFRWMREHEDLRNHYVYAREIGAEVRFDEMEELAATATPETVQVVKLQIDTRKWSLAKQMPKKFGDRVALAGEDDSPLKVVIQGKDAEV
jgi:hypothetical protein